MDPTKSSRQGKFEPKVPTRRKKKTDAVKREAEESNAASLSSELLKLVKQSQEQSNAQGGRRDTKVAPTRVAFGFGSAAAGRAAAGFHKGGLSSGKSGGGGGGGGSGDGTVDKKKPIRSVQGAQDSIFFDDKSGRQKKESSEPWDYSKYHPVTLPLRQPFSEIGDEEEFGETDKVLDEDAESAADELNLRVESEEDRLLYFQIPSLLPLTKEASSSNANVGDVSSKKSEVVTLNKLTGGHMGKLLVYKSGAIKLQLGNTSFEALPGSQCVFSQELVAINAETKHCCFMGDISQRVVLIPDIDDLLRDPLADATGGLSFSLFGCRNHLLQNNIYGETS